MKRYRWLVASCLALGCAHAQKAQPPKAAPIAVTQPAPAAHALLELPALGLTLRPPGPVEIVATEQKVEDGPLQGAGVFCSVGSQDYLAVRYFRSGRDRASDDDALDHVRKSLKVSREAPISTGEWRGLELEGLSARGRDVWMRVYAVGDGMWLTQVEHSAGGQLDRAAARAFLDSIALTQPWSVRAFPESHFSVLLPDGGVQLDKEAMKLEGFTTGLGSWLGGVEGRLFFVATMPLAGEEAPDDRMDRAVGELTRAGNRVIWEGPFVFDGARGRDFLMQGHDSWTRLRIIITDTDLYMLQANARTKQGLLDTSVPRFMSSLRWF